MWIHITGLVCPYLFLYMARYTLSVFVCAGWDHVSAPPLRPVINFRPSSLFSLTHVWCVVVGHQAHMQRPVSSGLRERERVRWRDEYYHMRQADSFREARERESALGNRISTSQRPGCEGRVLSHTYSIMYVCTTRTTTVAEYPPKPFTHTGAILYRRHRSRF